MSKNELQALWGRVEEIAAEVESRLLEGHHFDHPNVPGGACSRVHAPILTSIQESR